MNDKPQFILIGGELINVRIIGRACMEREVLRIEFTTGGFTLLDDGTVEDLITIINKL